MCFFCVFFKIFYPENSWYVLIIIAMFDIHPNTLSCLSWWIDTVLQQPRIFIKFQLTPLFISFIIFYNKFHKSYIYWVWNKSMHLKRTWTRFIILLSSCFRFIQFLFYFPFIFLLFSTAGRVRWSLFRLCN